ncbi:MAG: T9SS type A sorting domain-containing protein, partial [Candidatus Kapaibacterium sp.]
PDTVIIVLAKERFGFDVPPACLECSHVFFDNLKIIEDASTDITNQNISSIEIYPNPAMDYIIIKSDCEDCLYDVTFTSIDGKLAKKYYSIKDVIDLQNSELGNGVFFVRIVETLSGKNFFKKITLD